MPRSKLREFPIGFFVRFFHNHGFLSVDDRPQWYVIDGGSRNYLGPLCETNCRRMLLNFVQWDPSCVICPGGNSNITSNINNRNVNNRFGAPATAARPGFSSNSTSLSDTTIDTRQIRR